MAQCSSPVAKASPLVSHLPGSPEQLLEQLAAAAVDVEVTLTPIMQQLAAAHGGELWELDCRFKSHASLERKAGGFARRIASQQGLSLPEAETVLFELHTSRPGVAGDPIVVDALRYTLVVPISQYAKCAIEMREELERLTGKAMLDRKNFWHGTQGYRGINDCYTASPSSSSLIRDLWFEVQIHTDESLKNKTLIHPIFEAFRKSSDTKEKVRVRDGPPALCPWGRGRVRGEVGEPLRSGTCGFLGLRGETRSCNLLARL